MFDDIRMSAANIVKAGRPSVVGPAPLRVLVIGGGPVGLSFATSLRALLGHSVSITVKEARWSLQDGLVQWKSDADGVRRRAQVVTLQSRVLSHLPPEVRKDLLSRTRHSAVWPTGPDSPVALGHPLNFRIRDLEDSLLDLARRMGIACYPEAVGPDGLRLETYDIVALADGPRSGLRTHFAAAFGQEDQTPYSLDGRQLSDEVLGLRVTSGLSDADSVVLTVAQQRFLLNALDGEGYLYIRLSAEEAAELRHTPCNQRVPALPVKGPEGALGWRVGERPFGPWNDPGSRLWPRVQEALTLFETSLDQVAEITSFSLSLRQRPRFTAELTPTGAARPVFGALLGDAANALHFWPGRGLNQGLVGAVSLARTLAKRKPAKPLRSADFTRHEAVMGALQHRHNDRAWRNMVLQHGGQTVSYAGLFSMLMQVPVCDRAQNIAVMTERLRQTADRLALRLPGTADPVRLAQRLNGLSDATLRMMAMGGGWETHQSGGEEVDLDELLPAPVLLPARRERRPGVTKPLWHRVAGRGGALPLR